jgi:UDP-N-acetylglucosamine 2-epimerase
MKPRIMTVFGTRPEAIKLAPVIAALRATSEVTVCVTAQHREMLDQVLRVFEIRVDVDLDLMRADQSLAGLTAAVLSGVGEVVAAHAPDLVIVQGDTTTTMAAALASFYARVPLAHVEAGLRTGDRLQPFPEELNRRATTMLADLHFAPTQLARDNLIAEGVAPRRITVTGNTGIDALLMAVRRLREGRAEARFPLDVQRLFDLPHLIVVTGHRRESFGVGLRNICEALRRIVDRHADVGIVYPVHLNRNVREPVHRLLGGSPRIALTGPLDYLPFVALMQRAQILLTDSGGIQEEAASLGVPVLVMREKTERPEGIAAGVARVVGTDADRICAAVEALLENEPRANSFAGVNPYGDGRAAERIARRIGEFVGGSGEP